MVRHTLSCSYNEKCLNSTIKAIGQNNKFNIIESSYKDNLSQSSVFYGSL